TKAGFAEKSSSKSRVRNSAGAGDPGRRWVCPTHTWSLSYHRLYIDDTKCHRMRLLVTRGKFVSSLQNDSRLAVARKAAQLFLERGFSGTSGDDIAEACGLSKRTIWRYFRNKESCVA